MKSLAIFISSLALLASTAHAITLDDFNDSGAASTSLPGVGDVSVTPSVSAIGGFRTLFALKNSFGAGFSRLETFPDPTFAGDRNYSLGYTQGVHTGQGIVTWDGENTGTSLSPIGLGSIDLTQDGGSALRVAIKFFDFPSSLPIDLAIKLYDSTNASGLKFSEVAVKLSQGITSPISIEIPFSAFTTVGSGSAQILGGGSFATSTSFGPAGSVNPKSLGAAQLILNGLTNSNAPDLTLDFVNTNGRCKIVPNAQGQVVDECGVCLDSQFANRGKDRCGVCLFGAGNYQYSLVVDECGVCPSATNYKNSKDECGLCPSAANYKNSKDACGVCGGSITNAAKCVNTQSNCITVEATQDVLKFEERLLDQARLALVRFRDESKRSVRNKCKIDELPVFTRRVNQAFSLIRAGGSSTFNKGIEVCGNSCVTVSYAAQVQSLTPQFSIIERITNSLAKQVGQCYRKKGIKQTGGVRGNASTFQSVNAGLNQLIEDCRAKQFCPP